MNSSKPTILVTGGAGFIGSHTCVELLKKEVLPFVNLFSYGQVESPYGSGQFIKDLTEHFDEDERVVTSEIEGKDAIMDSIKEFLGKGK